MPFRIILKTILNSGFYAVRIVVFRTGLVNLTNASVKAEKLKSGITPIGFIVFHKYFCFEVD
jgi:hypothetical protein